jgi:hypothetical protein
MKRVKTAQNWFGTPEVTVHGSKKDPIPCVGEIVMLTGGVKARVERLSTISSKIDAFHGDHVWTAHAYLNFSI